MKTDISLYLERKFKKNNLVLNTKNLGELFTKFDTVYSTLSTDFLDNYKREDTYCTVGLLAGNIVMAFAIKGLVLAFHFYLYQFRIFDFANTIPLWAMWILTFIMIDLVFYVYHRMSHRTRFLWAIHLSHHSSEEMNFAVSFRQAWFGPISNGFCGCPPHLHMPS